MKKNWPLFLILVLAFILRVWNLSSFPIGFTQDEAGIGYDSYSLLKTGKDQWGQSFPLVLRSFGDYKLPLYSYLSIPTIAVFGLTEFAVRLPNAVLGTIAVLATYLLVYILTNKKSFALCSAILFAISPWHIGMSRGAFEANLTTFFMPFGIWAFYKAKEKPGWMFVSALSFGLNLFSYHSARLVTPLIVFILVMSELKFLKKNISKYIPATITFALFLGVASYTMFAGASTRGLDILITTPTDNWAAMADRRYEAIQNGLSPALARLFVNKATSTFDTFATNYLSYLSPEFLFTKGVPHHNYGMIPGRGALYLVEAVFIITSMWAFSKKEGFEGQSLILLWILIAPIPAALTKGISPAGNRAAIMMPAVQILSAYGMFYLYQKIKQKKAFIFLIISILLLSTIFFLEDYFVHAPTNSYNQMQYGARETVEYLSQIEDKYPKIRISRSMSVPQIWISFYRHWDPKEVQDASVSWLKYEKQGLTYIDQLDHYDLGKYTFGNIFYSERKAEEPETLFVGKPEDFPENTKPLKVIYYPNQDPAYYIVDPRMDS